MTTTSFRHINYVGTRPKGDLDNQCRAKLCDLVRDVGCFYEIYAEKLYMVHLTKDQNSEDFCENANDPNCPFIFWTFHDNPGIKYEGFNMDFGPFNLAVTHQFCSKLKVWLDTQAYREPDKYVVVVLDENDLSRKLNATLLVAIAAMVLLHLTDQEVIQRLNFYMIHKGEPCKMSKDLVFRRKKKFTDVSGEPSLMNLTLEDCIRAFYAAIRFRFYDYYEFDQAEYLFYETVMSGDLNWIVPGKLLAFAGPSENHCPTPYSDRHLPQYYYHYFKDHNVSTIVRLNEPEYNGSTFQELGFDHQDLIFPDGYPPTSTIAGKFINIVDEAKGAVAVHCYAGIGRTGTLIAAYLIARYDFTPQMAVAWTRICRPGSVIGAQQDWLLKFDSLVVKNSDCQSPLRSTLTRKSKSKTIWLLTNEHVKTLRREAFNAVESSYEATEKTLGQAKALVLAKRNRSNPGKTRIRDPTFNRTVSAGESSECSTNTTSPVLDLGKTIPLMLHKSDIKGLKANETPKFYHLKDNKYEWRVKFPEPGYVALKYDLPEVSYEDQYPERRFVEPKLRLKFEKDKTQNSRLNLNGTKLPPPRFRPVAYLSLNV